MLKPRKKITRKELKRDPLLEVLYTLRHWWVANKKAVSRYGGLALIIVILSVLVIRWRATQNEKAAAVAGIAHIEFSNGNYNAVIATLGDVVEEYSGLKSFGHGLYLLARSEFFVQDTLNAEIHYRLYLDDYGKDPLLKSGAYAALGLIAEGRGNYSESAELFRKAGQSAPTTKLAYQYSIYAGRNYLLASQPAEALTILQPLLADEELDYQVSSEIQELIATARYLTEEGDGV
jgi:tetratricopeptide (TPR) repeat protein